MGTTKSVVTDWEQTRLINSRGRATSLEKLDIGVELTAAVLIAAVTVLCGWVKL